MRTWLVAGIASFFFNLVCLFAGYRSLEGSDPFVMGASLYVMGTALGYVHGLALGRASVAPVGLAALAAATLPCIPVLLVTYGIALIGAPLVVAYGALATVGAYLGAKAKASCHVNV
jgi:hypothetical protein